MRYSREEIKQQIRARVVELVSALGNDPTALADGGLIPEAGLLDSASILELIVWYEDFFQIPLEQEEITIDNLGSIDLMADYAVARLKR